MVLRRNRGVHHHFTGGGTGAWEVGVRFSQWNASDFAGAPGSVAAGGFDSAKFTSKAKATTLMLQVHHEGKAVVSSGTREKAEHDVSRLHGHGLWATMQRDWATWAAPSIRSSDERQPPRW